MAQPSQPTDIGLSDSRKAMSKRTKIAIVVAIVILIVVGFIFYLYVYRARLQWTNFTTRDNYPEKSVHVEGTIVNSGMRDATNVQLIIRIYGYSSDVFSTETIDVDKISGGESHYISRDIQYSGGHPTMFSVKAELKWKD